MPIGIFAYQASHFETQGWVESRQTAVGNAVDNHLYLHGFGAGVVGHVRGESFTLKIRGVTGSLIRVVVDDVAVTTFSSGSASYIDATVATGSDAWHKVEVKSALNSPGPILSRDTFLRVSGSTPAADGPSGWGTLYHTALPPFSAASSRWGFSVSTTNYDHSPAYPYVRANMTQSSFKFRASLDRLLLLGEIYRHTLVVRRNGIEVFRQVGPTSNPDPWKWRLVVDNAGDTAPADYEILVPWIDQGGYCTLPQVRMVGGTGLLAREKVRDMRPVLGVLGTSISARTAGDNTSGWIYQGCELARWQSLNRAENGAKAAQMLSWLGSPLAENAQALLSRSLVAPDAILIEVGANDGGTAPADFGACVLSIVNQAIAGLNLAGKPNSPVFVLCLRRGNWDGATSARIQEALTHACQGATEPARAVYIDASGPDWFDPWVDSVDGVHPHAAGYAKLAQKLAGLLGQ